MHQASAEVWRWTRLQWAVVPFIHYFFLKRFLEFFKTVDVKMFLTAVKTDHKHLAVQCAGGEQLYNQ